MSEQESDVWLYYYLNDDAVAYREGPFVSISEARRAAQEVDLELYPLRIWIERDYKSLWERSRRGALSRTTAWSP